MLNFDSSVKNTLYALTLYCYKGTKQFTGFNFKDFNYTESLKRLNGLPTDTHRSLLHRDNKGLFLTNYRTG